MKVQKVEYEVLKETRIYPWLDEDASERETAFSAHIAVSHLPFMFGQIQVNVSSLTGGKFVDVKEFEETAAKFTEAMNKAIEISKSLTEK